MGCEVIILHEQMMITMFSVYQNLQCEAFINVVNKEMHFKRHFPAFLSQNNSSMIYFWKQRKNN